MKAEDVKNLVIGQHVMVRQCGEAWRGKVVGSWQYGEYVIVQDLRHPWRSTCHIRPVDVEPAPDYVSTGTLATPYIPTCSRIEVDPPGANCIGGATIKGIKYVMIPDRRDPKSDVSMLYPYRTFPRPTFRRSTDERRKSIVKTYANSSDPRIRALERRKK